MVRAAGLTISLDGWCAERRSSSHATRSARQRHPQVVAVRARGNRGQPFTSADEIAPDGSRLAGGTADSTKPLPALDETSLVDTSLDPHPAPYAGSRVFAKPAAGSPVLRARTKPPARCEPRTRTAMSMQRSVAGSTAHFRRGRADVFAGPDRRRDNQARHVGQAYDEVIPESTTSHC
jgi:hypothetical protein